MAARCRDNKGINRRGGGLTAPALTDKDKADIKVAAEMDLDYLAVSFPRDAADMDYARRLLTEAGGTAWLVAKIERAEAVADDEALDGLIRASDAVMVAQWRPGRGNRRRRAGRHPEEDHRPRPSPEQSG